MTADPCFLCANPGGEVLWCDDRLRIVLVGDAEHPGFVRVIWRDHVKEMTDLSDPDRAHCMKAVFAAESALRNILRPAKMNLASLGNQVPHVHWHVIPRFTDDPHFPNPVWGERLREVGRDPRAVPAGTLRAGLILALGPGHDRPET
ncbi:MAG: HIT domain-containing protein [Betaproteobacteria bacterium]|nr:HIT domain-containing protein [Betaproteobacteria bacterium]